MDRDQMREVANMKKLVVIAILILTVSLVFTGCKKQTKEETALQQKLVGHWKNTDAGDINYAGKGWEIHSGK